jgi:hypothetical protein
LDFVTRFTNLLGDAVFRVLSLCSPVAALVIISAAVGVLMLFVWRYTSNQEAIADARRQIAANLLATRLFKDHLAVTFRAQRLILRQSLRLLALAVRPTAIMLVPFVLVMVQIGLRYEHRPAAVGKPVRVTAKIKPGQSLEGLAGRLNLPEGLTRDPNDPCRADALSTVDWRITPSREGCHLLSFGDGGDVVEMPLCAGEGMARLSKVRGGPFWDRLLYSAEASVPESSVFDSITVHYPGRSTPILGWNIHWLITLLVVSIVFALLAKPILKVHI